MTVRRLEALADAVARLSGWHDPDTAAYQNRNPGALQAFGVRHERSTDGLRVFHSALDGYQALLFDLAIKCVGRSRSGLKSTSTLRELMLAYGQPATASAYIVKFLRRALKDLTITCDTQLSYFVEESNG